MALVEQIKSDLQKGAYDRVLLEKDEGKVSFGEDGFGVVKRKAKIGEVLHEEGFDFVSIVRLPRARRAPCAAPPARTAAATAC